MTATQNVLAETPNLDLLSDVLRQVHIAGGVFIRGEFTAPWAYLSTERERIVAAIRPSANYLMLFHLILEGSPRIRLRTGETAQLHPGDAIVFPNADTHVMADPEAAGECPTPIDHLLPPQPWSEMPVARIDGGGAPTRILCGYLECEELVTNPLLASLPRLVHVRATSDSAAQWRLASWSYAIEQCASGDASMLGKLPELVLADCLRQYLERLPAANRGWLGALHDPLLSNTLMLMHAQPSYRWTVPELAKRVAASRTVLADRFTQTLGVSPMRYLARWRLQLATELLRTTGTPVGAIAVRVGYESEPAFSRAFKRHVGAAPAAWRENHRPRV